MTSSFKGGREFYVNKAIAIVQVLRKHEARPFTLIASSKFAHLIRGLSCEIGRSLVSLRE